MRIAIGIILATLTTNTFASAASGHASGHSSAHSSAHAVEATTAVHVAETESAIAENAIISSTGAHVLINHENKNTIQNFNVMAKGVLVCYAAEKVFNDGKIK